MSNLYVRTGRSYSVLSQLFLICLTWHARDLMSFSRIHNIFYYNIVEAHCYVLIRERTDLGTDT